MRSAWLLALVVGLSACATRPISTTEATETTRRLPGGSAYAVASAETATLVIKRDSGFQWSGCTTRVHVDGVPVADIRVSEKVTLYVPAGAYILSAQPLEPICGGGLNETATTVAAGQSRAFRVGMGANGDSGIYPTAF